VCGQVLVDEEYVCEACVQRFDRTEQALNRDNETEKYFASCRHFAYGGCWLHFRKGTAFQRMIHQAKFHGGNPPLLYQLGRLAAKEWQDTGFFDFIDVIVPIPLHKKRLRDRGFNQSEYICRGLSEVLKIPMDTSHLTRIRATRQQSQSSYEERQMGVKDAFEVNHPEEWYGKTILLVDDIVTSGATMRAAMDAMKDVYSCRIVVFGLAKTK